MNKKLHDNIINGDIVMQPDGQYYISQPLCYEVIHISCNICMAIGFVSAAVLVGVIYVFHILGI